MTMGLPKHELSWNMDELDEKIKTMMYKGENEIRCGNKIILPYVCKVCGKQDKKSNITSHIEANHLDNISIPCKVCEKTFKNRDSLKNHNYRSHTNSI